MTLRLALSLFFGALALLSLGAAAFVNLAFSAANAKEHVDLERFK